MEFRLQLIKRMPVTFPKNQQNTIRFKSKLLTDNETLNRIVNSRSLQCLNDLEFKILNRLYKEEKLK